MPTTPTDPSAATPQTQFFDAVRASLANGSLIKLVLAGPRGPKPDLLRVLVRPLTLKGRACLSLTYHHRTRDLTRNLPVEEGLAELAALIAERFDNLHLLTPTEELQLAISRKGKASLRRSRKAGDELPASADGSQSSPATAPAAHDRAKHRPVDIAAPWLQALGVTDADGRLVPAMARKWKQINRFVEVLDAALDDAPSLAAGEAPLEVLDFGAGKGYLTFAVHAHLARRYPGRALRVTGLDLKDDLVRLGNETAARLGLQQGALGLHFELGDVRAAAPRPADLMIALHACDTATDHAMHYGVRAGARLILCSPCCHKELRPQLRSPLLLLPLLRHGIHLGQEAEMLTDGLRALLLEAEGYDARVFEFTSLEHTHKNKMILAVKREQAGPVAPEALRGQVRELKAHYGVAVQCLETLLEGDDRERRTQSAPTRSA